MKHILLFKKTLVVFFWYLGLCFDNSFHRVTWGQGYLTSLGVPPAALMWLWSPGPWGTGRGPLGKSWFRRSQGRLRELCGEKDKLRSAAWGGEVACAGYAYKCLCMWLGGWLWDGNTHTNTLALTQTIKQHLTNTDTQRDSHDTQA